MDSRHTSHEAALFNQIISVINAFSEENLDYLISQQELQTNIKTICSVIYACAHLQEDIAALLAKKNLLSIDPVAFPVLEPDTVFNMHEFERVFKQIQLLIEKAEKMERSEKAKEFYDRLLGLLKKYRMDITS